VLVAKSEKARVDPQKIIEVKHSAFAERTLGLTSMMLRSGRAPFSRRLQASKPPSEHLPHGCVTDGNTTSGCAHAAEVDGTLDSGAASTMFIPRSPVLTCRGLRRRLRHRGEGPLHVWRACRRCERLAFALDCRSTRARLTSGTSTPWSMMAQ